MKRIARTLLAAAATMGLATVASTAGLDAQGKSKHWKRLPAAVSDVIQQNRPAADIAKLTVEKEDGIAFYDVEFAAGQGEMDVAEDGTVLDIATVIALKDVPEVVAAAIRTVAKGKSIKQLTRSEVRAEIVREGGKGRISKLATPRYVYEAEFSKGEVEISSEGKVIKQ
jgi:hypothetical protein